MFVQFVKRFLAKNYFFFFILFLFPQDMAGGCLLRLYLYWGTGGRGAGERRLLFWHFLVDMHKNYRQVRLR
jgi:hypothetical protein